MPIDPVKHLGMLVKQPRLQQNMTQEQLSVKSGISLRHIANIEKARASASFEIAYTLIRELNIPVDMVLYSDRIDQDELTQETIQLIRSRNQNDLKFIKNSLDNLIKNLDEYKENE